MFSYVMLGVNDFEVLKKFYDVVLGVLGYEFGVFDEYGWVFYYMLKGILVLIKLINGEVVIYGNGIIFGFVVCILELVDEWYKVGSENGGVLCEDLLGIWGNGEC